MAHVHREPYVTLAGVTADRALIAWGAFFFEISGEAWAEEERRDWVDDGDRQGMFLTKGRYENEFTT